MRSWLMGLSRTQAILLASAFVPYLLLLRGAARASVEYAPWWWLPILVTALAFVLLEHLSRVGVRSFLAYLFAWFTIFGSAVVLFLAGYYIADARPRPCDTAVAICTLRAAARNCAPAPMIANRYCHNGECWRQDDTCGCAMPDGSVVPFRPAVKETP